MLKQAETLEPRLFRGLAGTGEKLRGMQNATNIAFCLGAHKVIAEMAKNPVLAELRDKMAPKTRDLTGLLTANTEAIGQGAAMANRPAPKTDPGHFPAPKV